eukprot:TRINITY_DN1341_c0_g1_i1.p1 TRINITY_DN1341_c0_g1~~TRINITY_DN1341_c0_g1_i1.p1  ORF type:complete len:1290 (+),score=340.11 TRINITY_DN1341_c0_g1_i1:82-3951(+)
MAAIRQISDKVDEGDPTILFKLEEELAVGSFGTVYRALNKDGAEVAVKIIEIEDEDNISDIVTEMTILRKCSHPNMVKYYGSWLKGKDLFIVMELASGGSLLSIYDDFPRDHAPCDEMEIAFVLRESLKGLAYLHGMSIIHRDIKAANILVTGAGEVKLADFGVSAQLTADKPNRLTLIGTPYWMAPEVINMDSSNPYDTKSDIWSIGITAIELAEKNPPLTEFAPMRALCMIPFNPPPSLKPAHWSLPFHEFLQMCLLKDPRHRKSATDLLKHPFLNLPADLNLSNLLARHRQLELDSNTDALALAKKWEAFLNALPEQAEDPGQDDSESADNINDSGTVVFSRTPSGNSVGQILAVSRSKATILDPRTARPTTIVANQEQRDENQMKIVERRIVKQQLNELRKLQESHRRVIEQLDAKHQAEKENFNKMYVGKVGQREKQRSQVETNMKRQHQMEREERMKVHQLDIKNLQKKLETEHKLRRKQVDDHLKQEMRDFKNNVKDRQKSLSQSYKTLTSEQKKTKQKDDGAELTLAESKFQHGLHLEKLREIQILQMETLKKHLDLQQQQMKEILGMQFYHYKKQSQAKSDSQLLVQDSQKELQHNIHQAEWKQYEIKHNTLHVQLKAQEAMQQDQFDKSVAARAREKMKMFRASLTQHQKLMNEKEKEFKRQLTKENLSKKEVSQLSKEKRESNKDAIDHKVKEFEAALEEEHMKEEAEFQETKVRQREAFVDGQESQKRSLQFNHIKQEQALQQSQHSQQVQLLKEMHSNLQTLLRRHMLEEEDYQKQMEEQIFQMQRQHQLQRVQMLQQHHIEENQLWKGLKRDIGEIHQRNLKEMEDMNLKHRFELEALSQENAELRRALTLSHSSRTLQLEQMIAQDEAQMIQLHQQHQASKIKALKKKQRQQSMEYTINAGDGEGQTRLHAACTSGNLAEVFQLVARGADINLTDKAGWTPLHCASHSKSKDIFKYLSDQDDIDVHVKTDSGATPLHYFCRYFDGKIYDEEEDHVVEKLIHRGALVNETTSNAETPLHNACWSGNLGIVRVLVQQGAEINCLNKVGETPLMWAVRGHHLDIVQYLLSVHARTDIVGKNGNLLNVAQQSDAPPEMLRLLNSVSEGVLFGQIPLSEVATVHRPAPVPRISTLVAVQSHTPYLSPLPSPAKFHPVVVEEGSKPPLPPPEDLSEASDSEDSYSESEDQLPQSQSDESDEELPQEPIPTIPTSQFMTLSLDPSSYEFLLNNLEQFAAKKEEVKIPYEPVFSLPPVPIVPAFESDSEDEEVPIPDFANVP